MIDTEEYYLESFIPRGIFTGRNKKTSKPD